MELTIKFTPLVLAVLFTGLSAGLCFTWSNSVTPGIGKLDNLGYLQSFQQMNRTIVNPVFLVVFFAPILLYLLNLYLFKDTSSTFIFLLIMATTFYYFGVVHVTIFGNVPLNEMLDKTDLSLASLEDLKYLRDSFEVKWNRLHLIRTISSTISFLLLISSLLQIS